VHPPLYRLLPLTILILLTALPTRAQRHHYWDTNYDSLRHSLTRPQPDTARLRTLVHLLDINELTDAQRREQALPLLDELLRLNGQLRRLNDQPYRLLRRGVQLWQQGTDDSLALRSLHQAIDAFDRQRHPIPRLLIDLAPLYNRLHDSGNRLTYFQRKLAYYRTHGLAHNAAACYLVLGGSYRHRGDLNQAISYYLRAADLFHRFENSYYITELMVAGSTYADWGNTQKATEYLQQAMRLANRYPHLYLRRFFILQALARVQMRQQHYPAALRYADQALQVASQDSVIREIGTAYGLLLKSSVLLHVDAPRARPLLTRAQQLADSLQLGISGRLGDFPLDATWARYYEAQGDYARAEAYLLGAYRKAVDGKLDLLRPNLLLQLIHFYDARRQPGRMQRYTHQYLALLDSLNAAQSAYRVAQYENERAEQTRNSQIAGLRQERAVQAVRLRQRSLLLGLALAAVAVVSGLGMVLYRQLRLHQRTLAQLRQTQNQLVAAEKWAFVGEVSAGIAHELQNPLHFMKRFAEVSSAMIDGMQTPGPARPNGLEHEILVGLKQNLQEISQHGLRASAIIREMLEHSRTSSGPRQPTDLNALIREQVRLAQEAQPSPAPVAVDLDASLPPLNLMAPDISRVLLNLLTNAFYAVAQRAREAGPGYRPAVRVSTRRVGEQAEIRVLDNGPGMNQAVKARIFQPFFTTKPLGEGTGLGLSLSHDIVTKGHGGSLRVETREGEGAEFIVTLPMV
jgi:signal transduction histidine kinase